MRRKYVFLAIGLMAMPLQSQQMDPTRPPLDVGVAGQSGGIPQAAMKLDGIITRNGKHFALVGKQALGRGDRLGGLEIVSVEADKVLLRDQNKNVTLQLNMAQNMKKSEANGF
ncbi:hypothetical protein P2G88_12855 [Aliiglaciecola sp. CAU 1673]|uniref:hypothetical protein n=1 Tax=Aliiglaciecola sp. CAU 1673 TaxID=3032595 RepID=UPI0023DC69CE|nr:hypothetical protein [Aliiglaciecola sp. CAU 1673]MDF2179142.1 hypothetical protein [Aliiglaciecola sp. CAU 1673]